VALAAPALPQSSESRRARAASFLGESRRAGRREGDMRASATRTLAGAALLSLAASAAAPADEPAALTAGAPIEREIAPGATDVYTVDLAKGSVLRGVVEQRGVDVVVRVLDPDGVQLVEIDSPNGAEGPEPIDVEAKVAGRHTIEVRPLGETPGSGRYEIRVDRVLSAEERAAEIAAVEARHAAAVAWLKEHAIPLATAEAGSGFDDLAPLREVVGDARVVALGEATHGTREFFQMKHRLLEFLVTEMGFTAFGIEATLPEAFDVDRWVVTGEGDPARALAGLYFWTWNTEEVMDLLEWMRAWNEDAAHSRKVRFYGFDMQSPTRAAKVALEGLAEVDARAAKRLRPALAAVTSAYVASMASEADGASAAMQDAAAALENGLATRKAELAARRGEEEAERCLRCATVLRQYFELRSSGASDSSGVRDRSMAENARWALEQEGPDGKIVLWAHNGHVSNAPLAMGRHLREAFGDDLRVIGFAFFEGAFQAIRWPPPLSGLTTFMAPPAPPGTLDAALAETGFDLCAWDLRALPAEGPAAEWFREVHGTRSIGAVGSAQIARMAFNRRPVQDCYDALVFVRKTSAARAMASALRRASERLAAPANLGFERGEVGAMPMHWGPARWGEDAFGYRVDAREGAAAEGARSLCIEGSPGKRYGERAGSALQVLAPESYAGKRVRLAASVRTEGAVAAYVAIAPRQAAPGSSSARCARAPDGSRWRRIAVEADVPSDAMSVALQVAAEGVGRAWFDDLSFEVVGEASAAAR
jgi:erythromycin esterase